VSCVLVGLVGLSGSGPFVSLSKQICLVNSNRISPVV
jgi:hypothetical protein